MQRFFLNCIACISAKQAICSWQPENFKRENFCTNSNGYN